MDRITKQNSSNPMTNQSGQRMPVWFMPMVFGIALLVAVVVAMVMCIRWRQMRSSTNSSHEEEEGYEEISAKKSSRNRKRNTDKDDYETIPVILKKTPINSNKNTDREYKTLSSVRPQHEREYASLNKATCSSKTSLSSLTSGCDVKEDRSKNRTKRQGLVLPSLSNPREDTADRTCVSQARSLDDITTQSTKQVKPVNMLTSSNVTRSASMRPKPVKQVNMLTSQPGSGIASSNVTRTASMRPKPVKQVNMLTNQPGSGIASSNVTRTASMRPKPVTHPKPFLNQTVKKSARKVEYENATVVIHACADKTETRRIALGKM